VWALSHAPGRFALILGIVYMLPLFLGTLIAGMCAAMNTGSPVAPVRIIDF